MTRCALVGVVLFAACSSKADDYGTPPGGGGGGGSGTIDAPTVTPKDAPVVKMDAGFNDAIIPVDAPRVPGRVCKLLDPRKLRECASTGAGGYTVRLGAATALTMDDGTFEIDAPSGNAEWVVLGDDIVTSHRPFGDYQIPVMTKTMFATLLSTNSITPIPGEGTIMAEVLKDAIGHPNCVATTTPVSPDGELYDTGSEFVWGRAATGADGAIFVPGVVESAMASLKVAPPTPEASVTVSMAVYDGAITFVTVPIE